MPILVTGLVFAIASGIVAYRVGGPYGERLENGPRSRQVFNEETGELELAIYDLDGNLRYDTWSYWDGERLLRREHDDDEDGRIDHWWYFRHDQTLERLERDTDGDGRPDERTLFDAGGIEFLPASLAPVDHVAPHAGGTK